MKIAINTEQPLDDVVVELERLGYKATGLPNLTNPTVSIRTHNDDAYKHLKRFTFLAWHVNAIDSKWRLTTLTELRSMP